MFIPGETLTHTFTIPFDKVNIDTLIVSYRQYERLVLEKIVTSKTSMLPREDGKLDVSVHLTEEESLLFADENTVGIQVNILFVDGSRIASNEMYEETGLQHIDEIGAEAKQEGFGTMYIDDDGVLIYEHNTTGDYFSIDNDGFLVIERRVV